MVSHAEPYGLLNDLRREPIAAVDFLLPVEDRTAEGAAGLERRDNALLTANATPVIDEERYRLSDVSQRGEIDPLVEAVDELRTRGIDQRRHIAVEAEEAGICCRC